MRTPLVSERISVNLEILRFEPVLIGFVTSQEIVVSYSPFDSILNGVAYQNPARTPVAKLWVISRIIDVYSAPVSEVQETSQLGVVGLKKGQVKPSLLQEGPCHFPEKLLPFQVYESHFSCVTLSVKS